MKNNGFGKTCRLKVWDEPQIKSLGINPKKRPQELPKKEFSTNSEVKVQGKFKVKCFKI